MENRLKTKKSPNLFVVGAAKSGTTAIYNFLDQHPDIYMSPLKEPHFFCDDIRRENFSMQYKRRTRFNIDAYLSKKKLSKKHIAYLNNTTHYLELFREHSDEKYLGEVSNGYLYSTVAAQNIYNFNPNAKIIMILRDPCERAFSHCRQEYIGNFSEKVKTRNFVKHIIDDYNIKNDNWGGDSHTFVQLGLYYNQVKRYFDIFPKKNIQIMFYNDLKNNPKKFKNDLFSFLNVDNHKIDFTKKFNSSIIPKNFVIAFLFQILRNNGLIRNLFASKSKRFIKKLLFKENKEEIRSHDRKKILKFFINDIKKLELLINTDLKKWLD
jgi:hypothetical protein